MSIYSTLSTSIAALALTSTLAFAGDATTAGSDPLCARDAAFAQAAPGATGIEVANNCTAILAACATAAAAACIFDCTPPKGTPGSDGCDACVDDYADTCAQDSNCL